MNGKAIKAISLAATLVGAVAGVAGSWASKKENDEKIAEEVSKAVANALKKETN